MLPERRRFRRAADRVRAGTNVDTVLAESKRLIAEIDVLLEHSQALMNRQALLHRTWR